MKKIPLQFPEKHLCYCANHMKSVAASHYFNLLSQIKTATAGSHQPDDLLEVHVLPGELLRLMEQLGECHERLTSGLHLAMKKSLQQQLQSLFSTEIVKAEAERDAELIASIQYLGEQMGKRDTEIETWQTSQMNEGRNFLIQ